MTVGEQVEQLEERLASMEVEIAMLRATLHEHVRTRRVVVVDDHGVERIVLDARHHTGSVLVKLSGRNGATTGVEIYAADAETGPPEVGLCVLRDGDVVSRWTAG